MLINEKQNSLIIPNKCRDSYSFEEIINLLPVIYEKRINALDLSNLVFVDPYSMVCLLLLGKHILKSTGEKLKLINIPVNIHQYLSRMDFFKGNIFTSGKLNEKLLYKRSSFSNRVIEITAIPNKERESIKAISRIISLFRERANYILKYWLSAPVIDYFVTVISEVCQNIFEHSLDSGYCTMQTYSMGTEHIVKLVIADSGIGIKQSFANRSDIVFESNAKLIEMALTTPISSKRRFGYGLCQVNTIIEKLRGAIFIRSADSSVAVMYNKNFGGVSHSFLRNDLMEYPGTQIVISLFS